VKLVGAAYLLYLGIRELRRARPATGEQTRPTVVACSDSREG
jgi:threonine/homoserine/homoserine lactone efflux protein